MTKVFDYIIDLKPEESWEKTLQFWNLRKGRIRYHIRDNYFFVDRGMSLSGCSACSYGEKYQMKFFIVGNEPDKTQVTVNVRLKFGSGAQWKIASNLMKEWALFVGTVPQEFGQKWFIITKALFWVWSIIIIIVIIIFSLSY